MFVVVCLPMSPQRFSCLYCTSPEMPLELPAFPLNTLKTEGGGARKIIWDPVLNVWSKLGTGVRERFLYTPVITPRKNSEEKIGGEGGSVGLGGHFHIFLVAFVCFIWPYYYYIS